MERVRNINNFVLPDEASREGLRRCSNGETVRKGRRPASSNDYSAGIQVPDQEGRVGDPDNIQGSEK